MNEISDKKVGVRYYPVESNGTFSNVQNLFAVIEIDKDETSCEVVGNSISGRITDASTGNPISNVLVRITGATNRNSFTNSNGEYSFTSLNSGAYNVEASKSGYITEDRNIALSGTPVIVNFVLSETLSSNAYRIVLTWDANPLDLDAHLIKGLYHIYWNDLGSEFSQPYAILDIDDITSYGPETITIFTLNNDYSKYYVHNYSGENNGDIDIKMSNAIVKVYKGSNLIKTYTVPTQGTGYYWYVFDITSSGIVIDKDYITTSPPGNYNLPFEEMPKLKNK